MRVSRDGPAAVPHARGPVVSAFRTPSGGPARSIRTVREKLIMKSRQIVKKYDLKKEELEAQLDAALGDKAGQDVAAIYEGSVGNFETDTIHSGRIVDVINDEVVVDVGYKSEGIIKIHEFDDPSEIDVGSTSSSKRWRARAG
jgi:hypothetical protein